MRRDECWNKKMNSFYEHIGQELRWVRPNRRRGDYELRAGEEALVRISYEGEHRGRVRVEGGGGGWVIELKGLAQSIKVSPVDARAGEEAPSIARGLTGWATVRFPDGRTFRWQCTSFWRGIWTWVDSAGTPLLQQKRGALVQVEPAAQELAGERSADLALLAALGWFLHKQQELSAAYSGSIVPIIGS
jgi:hypothetical protein